MGRGTWGPLHPRGSQTPQITLTLASTSPSMRRAAQTLPRAPWPPHSAASPCAGRPPAPGLTRWWSARSTGCKGRRTPPGGRSRRKSPAPGCWKGSEACEGQPRTREADTGAPPPPPLTLPAEAGRPVPSCLLALPHQGARWCGFVSPGHRPGYLMDSSMSFKDRSASSNLLRASWAAGGGSRGQRW